MAPRNQRNTRPALWPECRGAMAALIRTNQWRVSPLGAIETWPQALKTAVEIMLHSRQPAYVCWGRALTTLYNDAAIGLIGPRHPRTLGRPYAEVFPDSWDDIKPVIEAAFAGEAQHVVGQRISRGDHPASWYTYTWTPLDDGSGKIAGLYCVATETSLTIGDEQLRTVLENARDAVSMLDLASGRYVFISPSHVALTGFSEDELKAFTPAEILARLHPDDVPRLRHPKVGDSDAFEGNIEYRWMVKSGDYRWFSVSRKLVRDDGGRPIALVNVNRDVTDRKRAELEVLASRATLDAALSSMTDAVYITDADGRFLQMNQSFAAFHRYKNVEECAATFADFVRDFDVYFPDCRPATPDDRPVARALHGESAVGVEYSLVRKATGEAWIGSYSFGPIRNAAGTITGAVITARDVTEQRAEELRVQSLKEQLMHVGRVSELSQVSAGIAHELNQPLTAMLNYSTTARRLIAKNDVASIEAAALAIARAGEQAVRAGEIIRRMRDFVEKRDTNRAPDDINAIVTEAAELGLIGAKAEGVDTVFELAPDLPAVVADRVQIEQVLVNLMHNAIDAMADCKARRLVLSTRRAGRAVEVTVSDTGSGIPGELEEKLFQPFVTTKPTGMGIGLAISRQIIEAHAGDITARSNDGTTVFRFTLPLA